jgi:hypothetical protein
VPERMMSAPAWEHAGEDECRKWLGIDLAVWEGLRRAGLLPPPDIGWSRQTEQWNWQTVAAFSVLLPWLVQMAVKAKSSGKVGKSAGQLPESAGQVGESGGGDSGGKKVRL